LCNTQNKVDGGYSGPIYNCCISGNLLFVQAKNMKDEELHAAFSELNQKLNTTEESACVLRMANRIFPGKQFAVKETFMTGLKNYILARYSKKLALISGHLFPLSSRLVLMIAVVDIKGPSS